MDGHKHCQKCLRSWDGWTQTLSKVSDVMRWTHLSNVSAGREMSGQTQSIVIVLLIRNSTVMRWINTKTVKCLSHEVDGCTHCQKCRSWDGWTQTLSNVFRSWDGLTKTIRAPPPPPPPPPPPAQHVVTRALHILITPTEQTSYPEKWTKLQLMHQRILLTKEYMNKRLITTVDQQNWVKMAANIVWWWTSA